MLKCQAGSDLDGDSTARDVFLLRKRGIRGVRRDSGDIGPQPGHLKIDVEGALKVVLRNLRTYLFHVRSLAYLRF